MKVAKGRRVNLPLYMITAYSLVGYLIFQIIIGAIWGRKFTQKLSESTDTKERQGMYKIWVRSLIVNFGIMGAFAFLYLNEFIISFDMPYDFWDQIEIWELGFGLSLEMVKILALGYVGLFIVASLIGIYRAMKRARNHDQAPKTIGNIIGIIPRNEDEQKFGLAITFAAAICEEIIFRMALTLAFYFILNDALYAIMAQSAMFALMHAYQGLVGVLSTFMLGLLFSLVFVLTQNIIYAMIVHFMFNFKTLVVFPIIYRPYLSALNKS